MKLEYLADGSDDCPLICLFEFTPAEVHELRKLVRSLVSGERQSAALQNEAWTVPIGGCQLSLRRGTRDEGVHQLEPRKFECVLSSDRSCNVEGLLDPFCDSSTTGFQWLTHDGRVSLLISQSGKW